MDRVYIEDYKRLNTLSPTIVREFELFKESLFSNVLDFTNSPERFPFKGLRYDMETLTVYNFDGYKKLSYEDAAAIAFNKYYRAISGFILEYECRIIYLGIACAVGPRQAIKIMQKCAKVPQDGIVGPVTRDKMQYVSKQCLLNQINTLSYSIKMFLHANKLI